MFIVILPARIQNVCTRRKATKKIRRLQQRILGNFWKYSRLLHSVILFSRRGHPKLPGLRENMEAVLLYYLFFFPFNKCFCFFLFFFPSAFFVSFCFFPKPVRSKRIFFLPFLAFSLKCFFFQTQPWTWRNRTRLRTTAKLHLVYIRSFLSRKRKKKRAKEKCIKKRRQSGKKTLKSHLDLQKSA